MFFSIWTSLPPHFSSDYPAVTCAIHCWPSDVGLIDTYTHTYSDLNLFWHAVMVWWLLHTNIYVVFVQPLVYITKSLWQNDTEYIYIKSLVAWKEGERGDDMQQRAAGLNWTHSCSLCTRGICLTRWVNQHPKYHFSSCLHVYAYCAGVLIKYWLFHHGGVIALTITSICLTHFFSQMHMNSLP